MGIEDSSASVDAFSSPSHHSHALAPLEVLRLVHLLPDVLGGPEEGDSDVVVPPLEERLSLEVDEAVLAGAEEDADELVADAHVDLEEAAELDGADGAGQGRLLAMRL